MSYKSLKHYVSSITLVLFFSLPSASLHALEVGVNETIIYQELPGRKTLENTTLYNRILSDFFSDQVNRVTYRSGDTKQSLIFTSSKTMRAIVPETRLP